MKRSIMALVLSIIMSCGLHAFQKTYDGLDYNIDLNGSIIKAGDGYLMTGNNGYYAGVMLMVDSAGNCVWTRTSEDYPFYGACSVSGGFLVISRGHPGAPTPAVMHVDQYGNCITVRGNPDQYLRMQKIVGSGTGALIAGYVGFSLTGYMEKVDASGDCVWARSYGTDIVINSAAQGTAGEIYAAGSAYNSGYYYGFVMKTDADGNSLWSYSTDPDYEAEFFDVTTTADGGCLAAGEKYNYTRNNYDLHLLKMSSAGAVQWTRSYGWTKRDAIENIVQTPNLDYGYALMCAEATDEYSDDYGVFIMTVDAEGNCKNVTAVTNRDYMFYPRGVYAGDGKIVVSARTYSTVYPDGNIVLQDLQLDRQSTVAPPSGNDPGSSADSYPCPQPAKDTVRFVYTLGSAANVKIYIYNFLNRLVAENTSDEAAGSNVNTTVDISKLKNGMYYYRIVAKHNDGSETRFKLSKFAVKK